MEIEFPAIYKAIGFVIAGMIGSGDSAPEDYRAQDEIYTLGLSKYRERFATAEAELSRLSDENLREVACSDSSPLISEDTDGLLSRLAEYI